MKPLTEDTALQCVMENNDLLTLLSEIAAKTFREAGGFRAIGHIETAAQLEKLAEMLGDIYIPGVKISR
jgi:hypothetical protein